MTKASDFYFSTPFPGENGNSISFQVAIIPKASFDRDKQWPEEGAEYSAIFDVLPEGFTEVDIAIFEPRTEMKREDIETLLKNEGFIHNSKIDQDLVAMCCVPKYYFQSLKQNGGNPQ